MALLGNYSVLNKSAGRWLGGATQAPERSNWGKTGALRNFAFQSEASTALKLHGVPFGMSHPAAWLMPIKAGAMVARFSSGGYGETTLTLAMGVNITGLADGYGDAAGVGQLVVSGSGTANGGGSMTGLLQAAMAGSGTANGSGGITATLTAYGWMTGSAPGQGGGSLIPYAIGHLAGEIKPFTELSPQSLAESVWSKAIESGFSAQEVLRVIASVMAGKSEGFDANTPVFRDLGDTKDRVTATLDANGNRIAVSLDAS